MGMKIDSGAYVGTRGSITEYSGHESKTAVVKADLPAPPSVEKTIKTFIRKKLSHKIEDVRIAKLKNGNYLLSADMKGRTKGEHAVYVLEIGPRGGKINLYKDSYYADGTLKHRKYKIKNRRRVQKK